MVERDEIKIAIEEGKPLIDIVENQTRYGRLIGQPPVQLGNRMEPPAEACQQTDKRNRINDPDRVGDRLEDRVAAGHRPLHHTRFTAAPLYETRLKMILKGENWA